MVADEKDLLVVINHFDQRHLEGLYSLVDSLCQYKSVRNIDLCVVVNKSGVAPLDLQLPGVRYFYCRENTGMNIGAWDYAWQKHPEYRYFLFLQDECTILRDSWDIAFVDRLQDLSVGLVGESFNAKWNRPWDELKNKHRNRTSEGHELFGIPASKTDVYLECMRRWNIDVGESAGHARALVWGFRGDTLKALGGFPIGTNYGECIAAEIAVSKMVESLGLQVVQLEEKPFSYIGHSEWGDNSKIDAKNKWLYPLRKILKFWRRQ